ncbi:MAG: GNAT family N-acetyltransferase [Acidobacteria bacterium]|nr:GNAT family N-acetyltransferase [Acidobacteriota bacterium]
MDIVVRRAEAADAPAACEATRRSIAELCVDDHGGDPTTIATWLSNKTVQNVESWIASPGLIAVVAEAPGAIVGFALMNTGGGLALLYVSPDARFQGASTALLAFLEHEATRLGLHEVRLESTVTARQFYTARGYSPSGEPSLVFGRVTSYPMSKRLTPESVRTR